MLELARAFIQLNQPVVIVYSAQAEIAHRFQDLEIPSLAVRTFGNTIQAVTGLFRLPGIRRRIESFLVNTQTTSIVVPMEQIWQSFLSRFYSKRWPVLLFVHDADAHLGEESLVLKELSKLERKHSSGALALSDHVAKSLSLSHTFPDNRIWKSIHPAFTTETSLARVRRLPRDRVPVVGFFGRMAKYKGLTLGLESVALLRMRGYEVTFLIIGAGIPRDLPHIMDSGNSIDDGWVPEDEVQTALNRLDILLLPYIEASQSGVLSFAMSLGIPAVVTPVGVLMEQAQASGAAVIASDVTPNAVADSLEHLITEGSLYSELSSNALNSSHNECLSWQRLALDVTNALGILTEN